MFPLPPRKLQSRPFGKTPPKPKYYEIAREPQRISRKASFSGGTTGPAPKEPEPVRDESYRRWVASLPCFECGIQGFSQAAHPNTGKAKGKKLSDDKCFPMCCDRPGIKGCHGKFDRYELVMRWAMADYERAALEWTRKQERT